MKITQLDHFVLTVRDIDVTIDFYTRVLGMQAINFGDGRRALSFGAQKINLHQYGNEFEPKAENPIPGSADLCFLTATPLPDVIKHLKSCGITILEGPVERSGATGAIMSIYFRDPDMNLLEVSNPLAP
jgi:catechol 2,3-dioxygenase-like lactoylglutathione lyase family enzyme